MLNQATMDMLTAMKMTAMAAEFANQLKDPTFNELGFEERLGLLVNAEWNRRQSNKLNRFIRNAHFAVPSATVEGIEYHEDRKLDKAQRLRFATCQYIDEGHHIILKGASGNGKTYIACALGNAACRRFKKVQYIRMPELLDELSIARSGGTLKKVLESYKKKDLLILDCTCQAKVDTGKANLREALFGPVLKRAFVTQGGGRAMAIEEMDIVIQESRNVVGMG